MKCPTSPHPKHDLSFVGGAFATLARPLHCPRGVPLSRPRQVLDLPISMGTCLLLYAGGAFDELYCGWYEGCLPLLLW
jgi:hypothetical protein